MNTRAQSQVSKLDGVKLAFAAMLFAAAVVAFYYFAAHSLLARVLGLLAIGAVCLAIAYQTDLGKRAWIFGQEAWNEVRKVVWPTRQETTQTTVIVFGMVAIVAVILWLLDWILGGAVKLMIRQGG